MSVSPPLTAKLADHPSIEDQKLLVGNPPVLDPVRPALQIRDSKQDTSILAGWIILGIGYFTAAIPLLGFAIWIIGFLFCGAAGLLGIIGAAKGKPLAGVFLIIASIASFFLYLVVPFGVMFLMSAGER